MQTTSQTVSRILSEDVLTLTEARGEIAAATNRRPDKSTLVRWVNRGCYGTKLEAVRLGSQLLTSRQAITRFIERRTEATAN